MLAIFLIYILTFVCNASASPLIRRVLLLPRATNSTAPNPSDWVTEPAGRGTYSLLFSCFNTLFLCAWTAFHPNVPPKESDTRFLLQRIQWMIIAVFFPELVLFIAWDQWWAARCLKHEINRLGQSSNSETIRTNFVFRDSGACRLCSGNPRPGLQDVSSEAKDQNRVLALNAENRRVSVSSSPLGVSDLQATVEQADLPKKAKSFVPWTTEQAFFAVTGGLAVKTDSFWHEPRITLTPEGVVLLAEMDLLPSFSQAEVEERSQADIIAKLLVCLHALWFLVQSFARVVQGLPLTLLEVHTMTHIVCALGMYMIWLRKGYNIRNPIVLRDKRIVSIAALTALRADDTTWEFFDKWDGWPFHNEEDDNEGSEGDNDGIDSPEDDDLYDCPLMKAMADGVDFNNSLVLLMYRSWSILLASYPMNDLDFVDRESQIKYLSSSDAPFRNRINHFQAQKLRGLDKAGFPLQKSSRCSQQPDNIDVKMVRYENKAPNKIFAHLEAANKALDYLREHGYHFRWKRSGGRGPMEYYEGHAFIVHSHSNWLIKGRFRGKNSGYSEPKGIRHIAIIAVSCLYGAGHLSAWHFKFPTKAEMWSWRASCITMIASPLLLVLVIFLRKADEIVRRVRGRADPEKAEFGWFRRWCGYFLLTVMAVDTLYLGYAAATFYPLIRLFILGESLASLRCAANGTYATVEWTKFIPIAL
jgi:hypothetical protein